MMRLYSSTDTNDEALIPPHCTIPPMMEALFLPLTPMIGHNDGALFLP
ncbi:unnamed protein product [Staurois parvus]|uniref:Uncharacterized protein n=1 Tax=Staurois parvus TaxID=386267 RepID=A0ABN9FNI0_9NEOB|nr:unnamed protein product [Staurois parvus]